MNSAIAKQTTAQPHYDGAVLNTQTDGASVAAKLKRVGTAFSVLL
jgi:hypothetical protein